MSKERSSDGHLCELTAEQKEFAAAYLEEPEEPLRGRRVEEIRAWVLELGDLSSRLGDH
jgi:hypothetical protein